MKRMFVIYLLSIQLISLSQELKFSSHIGYATGEMKAFKKIMLSTGFNLGTELYIRYDLCVTASVGGSHLRFEYTDTANNSVFSKKYFLDVLVTLKKYYAVSKKSWLFWNFGIAPAYHFLDKKEIRNNSTTVIQKRKNLGFNFGVFGGFGFKTTVSPTVSVDIGLSAQTDYLFSYKNELDKIKTDKRLLLLSVYWKPKK